MTFAKVAFSAITLATLVACGGGGGAVSTASSTVSLSGVASKGLLSGADVQVYEVASDGALKTLGNKSSTDANGSYQINSIPATNNPSVVKVTTNNGTEMLDETKPLVNGKYQKGTAPLPGTEIRSMLPSLAANSEVHVTPFTEMAVSAAVSSGKLTSESMASAKYIVTESLGIDPFKTKPVNADATKSADQEKLMALLTTVAVAAKTTQCTGDASGVSCALKSLNDAAAIEKDATTGAYKVKSTDSIKTKLTGLKAGMAAYTPEVGSNVSSAKTTMAAYSIPNTPSPVDPTKAVQSASLDSFLRSIRTGFNTAETTINARTDAAKLRLEALVFDSASDGVNTLLSATDNCVLSSSKVFTCTGAGYTGSPGSYNFEYKSIDNAYIFKGTVSASLDSAGNVAISLVNTKTKISGTVKEQEINLVVNGNGFVDKSTAAALSFSKFTVKEYDNSTSTVKYAQIDLSGLSISANETTRKATLAAPLTISTSEGDSFSGKLNNLEITNVDVSSTEKKGYANNLDISFDIKSKEGNILTLSVVAAKDVAKFKPWLVASANNIPTESITIDSTLASNEKVGLNFSRTKYNEAAIAVKVTSNDNWINISANLDVAPSGKQSINKDGVTITSSGVYSAKISENNSGNFDGKLFEGTKQIGVITDGIIYVGTGKNDGIQVSLK